MGQTTRQELLLTLSAQTTVSALAISGDGRRIAAGTTSGAVYVWTADAR